MKLGITHGEGAAQGALDGAADSLQVLQGCSGETCGIGLLLLPVFAVGGAIAGGVSGAIAGHSSETLTDAESKARQLLDTAFLQTELLTRAENYGKANLDMNFLRLPPGDTQMLLETPDNKTFSDNSIDVVLELNLLRISLAYSLDLYAQARLISVKTGEVLSDDKYTYTSAPHDLEEWIRDGAEPLSAVIEMGLETIAENAIDDNFLLFYPSNPSAFKYDPSSSASEQKRTLRGGRIPHYVLSPLYPRLRADVDSIHPTLRWEAFPREYDLIDADGQRHRITDVHYDLRVFDTDRDSYALRSNTGPRAKTHLVPGQLVYEARAISEPYHKIANGLNACTEYFWTVRARFRRDEHTRATEWAAQSSGDLWRPAWELRHNTRTSVTPGWYYYRFSTPCEPSPPSPGLPNKKTAIHRHR